MTNEELCIRIQQGEQELTRELWDQVDKFTQLMARKFFRRLPAAVPVEIDDLYNASYLAFIKAIEYYKPDQGAGFLTALSLTMKTAFLEAAGYRSRRQQQDPIHNAMSLEMPLLWPTPYVIVSYTTLTPSR